MNYFAYPTAAERYANGRPFFHPLAIEKIQSICCKNRRVGQALDVGCGTGRSTLALLEVADEIVGLDSSPEMLSRAFNHERIRYVEAQAEHTPFADQSFGLVTVALAFHWLDHRPFLLEAHRVLQPDGWLVIYNDVFSGRMNGNAAFETWIREKYLVRYPSPVRSHPLPADSDASEYGFAPAGSDQFTHEVKFTPHQLVGYLLTQSNVISAVEVGTENVQSVADWMLKSVEPLFDRATGIFQFLCTIRFFKRI